RSEGGEIGLRVFVGQSSASASSSDLSRDALDALVARTLAMARLAPEDRFAGLAPEELVAHGPLPDLDIDDGGEASPEVLRARALECEGAALAVPGVTNSQGAGASAGRSVMALATSHGFAAATTGSTHGVSATMLAGEGAAMQRDYAHQSVRHLADLESATDTGRRAGERAVARMNPARLKSGSMPVVFDPRAGSSMLGHLAAAISGASVARGSSFLKDRLGERVFAGGTCVIDEPHRPRGLRSRAFDGEGLATRRATLIDDGVLTGWIAESAAARQLGIAPTGHAARGVSGAPSAAPSNLHMAAGTMTPAALMADIDEGFYVTELIGMGVNGLTGDYSRGAWGFAIRGGEIAEAVSGVTIAGNLAAMFAALIPADDLAFRYATNTPTLRIDGMTLAGD
ncbi:MAG: TldD/PmbA family protein, partial [Sphingomonadaceae bacterium]|nr:TldD/PmbA family protein [Sphingomonadaceae bacterium]